MEIAFLGSAGIGAVWGWLVARFDHGSRRLWAKLLLIGCATLLVCAQVFLNAGTLAVYFFLGATGATLLFHLAWRSTLRKGEGATQSQNGGLK